METITDLQRTIARVESREGKTWGTAFILHRDGLLVTCAHVLSNNNVKPGQPVCLRFVVDWKTPSPAQVLEDGWKYEGEDDIAFLKVESLPKGAIVAPLLEWRGLDQGSSPIPILACGFPIAKDKEIVADGKIVLYRSGLADNPELLLDAKNVTRGMSGGPIWDSRSGMNGVLGMVRQVYTGPEVEDLGKAIPIETVIGYAPRNWKVITQETKAIQDYRISIVQKFEYLDLNDAYWLGELKLPLDSLYVKLQAVGELPARDIPFDIELLKTRGITAKETREAANSRGKETGAPAHIQKLFFSAPKSPPPVSIETALKDSHHLVILGEPGSGKSTLLHYLALQYAQQYPITSLKTETQNSRLPIYLRLIEYAQDVHKFSLKQYLVERLSDQISPNLLGSYLQNGQCILLLDALDEVSEKLRRKVADRIDEFLHQEASFGKNRAVVTSRIAGYHSVKLRARSIKHYTLCPFQPTETEEFTRKWFQTVITTQQQTTKVQAQVERLITDFINEISQPGLDRLMDNPLLLRIAAALYAGDINTGLSKALPNRVGLYERYVEQLLTHRDEAKGIEPFWDNEDEALSALQEIAWAMHIAQEPLSNRQLIEVVEPLFGLRSKAKNFLRRLRERSGLLLAYAPVPGSAPDESLLAFSHLTFREYFVACYLFSKWLDEPDETWNIIRPARHHPEMYHPLLLFASLFGHRYKDGTSFIQKLWGTNDQETEALEKQIEDVLRRDLLLAGWCLLEMGVERVKSEVFSAYLMELLEVWENYPFVRLRDEIMNIIGAGATLEFREQLASFMVDLLLGERSQNVSFDLHNAAMRALGRLGVKNKEVLDAIIGALPICQEEPLAEHDMHWLNRLGLEREEDKSAFTRFQKSAIESLYLLGITNAEILNRLIMTLKIPSSIIRNTTAEILKKLSKTEPQVINGLVNILDEPYAATRYIAADVLVEIAKTTPIAIDALVNVIADQNENWQKRELAAKSLGNLISNAQDIVPTTVYEALANVLNYDESLPVIQAAIESLKMGLPVDNFSLSLKIVSALITSFVAQNHENEQGYESIAIQRIQNAAAGTLIELMIEDAPEWIVLKAENHRYPLLPLLTSGSVVLETLVLFLQMLYEQNPEVGEAMAQYFTSGPMLGLPMLQVEPEMILVCLMIQEGLDELGQQRLDELGLADDVTRWREIRKLLIPLVQHLQGREEDIVRRVMIQIFGNATLFMRYRDGLTHEMLVDQAAISTDGLENLMMCFLMTGFSFDQETREKYQDGVEKAILAWGQHRPSSEVIGKLCSIAKGQGDTDRRIIAVKLLSQLNPLPSQIKDLFIDLLGDDKVKRVAAEVVGRLNITDKRAIEALLNPDNLSSPTLLWFLPQVEEIFIKDLVKLGGNYEDIDKIIDLLAMIAIAGPLWIPTAVEGLGQLGRPTPKVIQTLIQVLPDREKEVRQAAIGSLMRLASINRNAVITALIQVCVEFHDYPDPTLEAIFSGAMNQYLVQEGISPIFIPLRLPDTHNYAYDALWSVATGELITNDVV